MAVMVTFMNPDGDAGTVWTEADGSVHADEEVQRFVQTYVTPPCVSEDGRTFRFRRVEAGGRNLSIADGELFVRALPWALGMTPQSFKARVTAST